MADPKTTAQPMKMVTFRRPQGEDRIIIPAGDDPEKHVRPELILRVQEEVPYCGACLYEGVECRYPECIQELQEALKDVGR